MSVHPKRRRRLLLFLGFLAAAALLIFLDNNRLVTTKYEVVSAEIGPETDGYRIVQLSDLHNKRFGGENSRLKQRVEALEPNMVVLTGDMVNARSDDFSAALELCSWLAQRYPTCFVVGNHELDRPYSDYVDLLRQIGDTGVAVLENDAVPIARDGSVRLFGLYTGLWHYDSGTDYAAAMDPAGVNRLIGECAQDSFNIVMTHSPDYFPQDVRWGADLVLTGHIHGGMVRLPFLGGLFSPGGSFFPRYDAGAYYEDDSMMIVSRGLGNSIGIRIMNPPEIVCVTLKGKR